MKKRIAIFMACLLTLNLLYPFISEGNKVFAASNSGGGVTLNTSFSKTLTTGNRSYVPEISSQSCASDQIFMEWNLLSDKATYTLNYYLRDYLSVDVVVTKENDKEIKVEYRPEYNKISQYPSVGSNGEINYSIYSNEEDDYIPVNKFPTGNNEYKIDNVNVDDVNDISKLKDNFPSFTLSPGFGFSIEYDSADFPAVHSLHFLWNSNGTFQFQTNGIEKGKFYDIKLDVTQTNGVKTPLSTMVVAGINGFKAVPIANGNIDTPPYKFNSTVDVYNSNDSNLFITGSAVISTSALNLANSETPAKKENGIIFTFDLPKKVDSNGKYSSPPNDVLINARISLTHTDSSLNYNVTLRDIFDTMNDSYKSSEVEILPSSSGISVLEYGVIKDAKNGDKLQVWLAGFESGLLFAETSLNLSSVAGDNNEYLFRSTLLNSRAYTFLDYKVDIQGNNYYITFKPYQGYKGAYYLYSQTSVTENDNLRPSDSSGFDPVVTKNCVDYTQNMMFPLSLETTSELANIYHIKFVPDGTNDSVYSQRVRLIADPKEITLSLPTDFKRLSHMLTPEIPGKYDKGVLNLSLSWSIATRTELEKLMAKYAPTKNEFTIEYSLYSTLTPLSTDTLPEKYADLHLTIKKIGNEYKYTSKVKYGDNSDGFVTLEEDAVLKYQAIGNERTYNVVQNLTLEAWRNSSGGGGSHVYFFYPNVYFLNLELNNVKGESGVHPYTIGSTAFVSMTLDPIIESEMPAPQNLKVTPGTVSTDPSGVLEFSLSSGKMRDYIRDNFTAVSGAAVNTAVFFNMYISSEESDLKALYTLEEGTGISDSKKRRDDRAANSVKTEYIPVPNQSLPYVLDFSKTTSLKVSNTGSYNGKAPLNALRDGERVMIYDIYNYKNNGTNIFGTGLPDLLNFKLEGLDKNQKYYIAIDFWFERSTTSSDTIERTSILSSIAAFTTAAQEVATGEEEKQPSAPKLDWLNKKNVLMNKATIWWDEIASSLSGNDPNITEKIEYEIVRSDTPVKEEHLLIIDDISAFWKQVSGDKRGYRTDGDEIKAYDPNSNTGYFNNTATDYDKSAYKRELGVLEFPNTGLDPNTVYFYYVRTVRIVKTGTDTTMKYSSWSQISVTTPPVQGPENLVVDRSNRDAYDSKKEAILRFDVPSSNPVAIEYIIKEDTGDWSNPIPVPANSISWAQSTLEGYISGSFKVTGLKPNTGYSFMVRVIDANGDVSMYSNSASTRTDIDQTDYDTEKEQNDWVDFFNNELAELIKQYYWLASDTASAFTAIYRPSMFDTLLNQSIDGQIRLTGSDKNASSLTYYIPASGLLSANEANKGFVINSDNMQIILPKNSFDPNTNTAIQDMIKQINNRALSDYMIKINITLSTISSVDGNEPASKQAKISFELVGLSVTNVDFDKAVVALIKDKIDSDATVSSIKTELANMIKNNSSNEQLVKYIETAVAKVYSQIMGDVDNRLTKAISKRTTLLTLNAPMILSCSASDSSASIKGYSSMNSSWTEHEVTIMGDRVAMSVTTPGLYVFAKSVLNLKGLETIAGANGIKAVIIKYGLDDFIGKGAAFDINSPATANMVAGIVSRLCGAPKGTDPLSYLKNNGVTVSTRNQYSSISNQESIYLMMFLYEKKTNTKVSTMTIRNFAATSGINGIDEKYKKSIQAAFELDVYNNKNMKPAESATTKDILTMLGNLNTKLKF